MTGETRAPIEATADAIVAADVQEGRPGKSLADAHQTSWPVIVSLVALLCGLVAFGLGLLLGGGPATAATTTTPDAAVPVSAQQPDTTTTPATPSYAGPAQVNIQFTCSGQQIAFPSPATLQIGPGVFDIAPTQTSPFMGTLGATFAVNASGASGTITGMLTTGTIQTLALVTQDTFFPCVGGPFPFIVTLPTGINVGAAVATGAPLADVIGANILIAASSVCDECGHVSINWTLVALMGGLGLISAGAFRLWWWYWKDRGELDDDQIFDGPFERLRIGGRGGIPR